MPLFDDPQESKLEPEYADTYNAWKTAPTPENTSTLLKTINPVLTSAIRSYGITGSPTLHSRAKLMALDAMQRYNPTQSKLRTHLMFQLRGLRRHAAREQQILSVPEQVALDLSHVRSGENYLRDQLGRDPSDAELSDHLKMSLKRLNYIRRSRPSYSEGSLQRASDEGEDIYAPAVNRQDNTYQWHEFVYHDLAPVDQLIMEHTLGLHGKPQLSNQALAKKLKVSPGAVSQRKAKIQAKLNLRDEFEVI